MSNLTVKRTIVTSMESYMVDPNTLNESMLTKVFVDDTKKFWYIMLNYKTCRTALATKVSFHPFRA